MTSHKLTRQFHDTYAIMYPGKLVKNVTFIVTHQCNLMCTYCYQYNKDNTEMSLETAKRCVDFLFDEDEKNSELINDISAHGIVLDFIGGEPLLKIELIDDIISYFLSEAIRRNHRWTTQYMISMSTNGILGDDLRVQQFIQRYFGRLSISVTIDGDKKAHDTCRIDHNGNGSYDKAIKLFRSAPEPIGGRKTKYTISPENLSILSSSIQYMATDEHVSTIYCNCVFENVWNIDHARELYIQLKDISDFLIETDSKLYITILDWGAGDHMPDSDTRNWCGGNAKMLAFDVDGTILPCMRYSSMSNDKQPVYRIGDIEHGIGNLPEDRERLNVLQSITRQSQSTQECLDCPINTGCAWCTAYNYEETGTPDKRVTYICVMHKARVLAQCYHHNKLHLKDKTHPPKKMNIPREWAIEIIGEDEYQMLLDLEQQAFADET